MIFFSNQLRLALQMPRETAPRRFLGQHDVSSSWGA